MKRWHLNALSSGAVISVALVGCSSEPPPPPPPDTGILSVTTATTGTNIDADGYRVQITGDDGGVIGPNETRIFTQLVVGDRQIELTAVAANCAVTGNNPRSETIATNQTTATSFDVSCQARTLQSIRIGQGTGTINVVVGQSVTGLATAIYDNGDEEPITTGSWGTGDMGVATVTADPSGLATLTGVSAGMTTIFVDFMGSRGMRDVTVAPATNPPPTFTAGTWSGQGTNPDGSTFTVCFNVDATLTNLVSSGSSCTNGAALVLQLAGLTDDLGGSCTVNILESQDVPIGFQTFFGLQRFTPQGVVETVFGEITGPGVARGEAEFNNVGNRCRGAWTAMPN